MQFDLPKEENSIIKVFGVGGGGSNAVNHMFRQGITGVDFYVCNTDQQALDISPIPNKIQLGMSLTDGRGAGSVAEVGKEAALENIDEIKEILGNNTKMVFITAGMGGGTGTGAAPIIAKAAKEMGILTVGIVTYPFVFEGRKRSKQAEDGLEQLRGNVDTLLIICNDKLREIYGNLSLKNAFAKADDILTTAAKGIAEIITVTGYINVDFEDVRTVMTDSGVAIMGSASAEGENRAIEAVQEALASPLLNDNNIEGANYILLNITSGQDEVLMDEITEITDYIQDEAGLTADIIWGSGYDENLGDKICVTLIATGFSTSKDIGGKEMGKSEPEKVIHNLTNEPKNEFKVAETPVVEAPKVEPVAQPKTEELPFVFDTKNEQQAPAKEVIKYNLYDEPAVENKAEQKEDVSVNNLANNNEANDEGSKPSFSFTYSQGMSAEKKEESSNEMNAQQTYTEEPKSANVAPSFSFSSQPTSTPPPSNQNNESAFAKELDEEENLRKSQERIAKLKMMSMKMNSPSGIEDLENEPAYIRRNVQLNNVTPSAEINQSRYTLGQDDENRTEIRTNNSFLHDNVD